ncbi:MAG: phenylalanyl-tRNA synthetase subunit alpha [Roseibium sp.]|uniref:phenylalanyl-tRNA synthetase subunit alpha n=1 Tax=Roseibium sp. TaxID=1936156 RepID=UPI001B17B834|nr:phenylalanyl-tRNA synthetase subunit alpha [Roseibium sp.]MBO6508034.1 phenylalanyl-tRNA synthetase subunit alpha [Roseibium sp.]MBO6890314.1 phenylalanyl-tRNA synthetase subunit alpha [Roseibium sp.]MBO6932660.1 phenylalanyl-tRNA synthetase subunit alpha [Roseibium sp.]
MSMLTRLFVVLALMLATLLPAAAQTTQTSDRDARVPTPTSFLEACADKIERRGRLRFCDTYFREKLGTEADALLYLRDRITRLRAGHEASSAEKYQSFLQAIYIVAFLTIASIILIASDKRISGTAKWAGLTSSAALLVMVIIVAMGWLGKYRAEYAAQFELGILRDRIETEAAQAISTGEQITPEMVRRWTEDFSEIGRRFAENYGEATILPELDRFNN